MKKTYLTLGMAALMVICLCGILYSQEDITALSDPAFAHPRRGAVPFNHDQHNTKAKIAECQTCHHVYKDGKLVPSGDSAGTNCSDCHSVKGGKGAMPLMPAYHRQCVMCHEAKGAGPVSCGECHPKKTVGK